MSGSNTIMEDRRRAFKKDNVSSLSLSLSPGQKKILGEVELK